MSAAKKIILMSFTLLSFMSAAQAQKATFNWLFGQKVGLNFNQSPPAIISNTNLNAIEGSSAISDGDGKLLFYSNGVTVMNKLNEVMDNGSGIAGDVSSTCNSVIIQLPGNDSLYYLFTVGAAGQALQGFRYHVINMRANNGLGKVIEKNMLVDNQYFEKIAAVRHCNRTDAWIMVRKWQSDEYHAYRFTASGIDIDAPVISHSGLSIGGYINNSLGALKFSSDGSKMVAVHSFDIDSVELMQFDKSTGILTNNIIFTPNLVHPSISLTGLYGAAFSASGNKLYISSSNSNAQSAVLYQYDVSVHNATAISLSRQLISQNGPWMAGALQLAPDNKIYYSMYKDTSLSVINNPEAAGIACNFSYNAIRMPQSQGEPVQYGLPTFVAGDMDPQFAPYNFSMVKPGDCTSLEVAFSINHTNGVDSVFWDFGDGIFSRSLATNHTYSDPGSYLVKLVLYTTGCGATTQVLRRDLQIGGTIVKDFLPKDTSLCKIANLPIGTTSTATRYLWNTGAITASITVNAAGTYWLQLDNNGCLSRDSIVVEIKPVASVSLGKDTSVCVDKPVFLAAQTTASAVRWNTGATSKTIKVTAPGQYIVTLQNTGLCSSADTVNITWGDCAIYIPSAFSPNGDNKNERFGLANGINAVGYALTIFNRYGETLFHSNDPANKWDGNYKGKPQPIGLYPWVLNFTNKYGFPQTETGSVMLIR
ncbi:MAG: hypothetical protein JWQ27_943 [Ferruginibacter sp.]|nr:hypothetical protein [Ferruginibacter sp.]